MPKLICPKCKVPDQVTMTNREKPFCKACGYEGEDWVDFYSYLHLSALELLRMYPNGFAVTWTGGLCEISEYPNRPGTLKAKPVRLFEGAYEEAYAMVKER